jgi:hypothetical protein
MPLLSTGFAWPGGVFYEGGGVVSQDVVPAQYPVAIAGHAYNIEPSLYRLTHVPLRRPANDDQAEPGEQSLNPMGLWRRSQSSWDLGAGQLWLDEQESTRRRFFSSIGVDVFNDRELHLLPTTEEKLDTANTNLRFLEADTYLYVMHGTNVIFSDGSGSEQDAAWTAGSNFTAATGLPGGNQLDMAFSGSHVYVVGSDNSIYRATPGTAGFGAAYFNPAAVVTRIWAALGRIFMAAGDVLLELTAVPGETTVFDHPSAQFTYSSLIGTPSGIYFAGNVGTGFGEIRRMVVNSAGTGFDPPVVVAEFPNEAVHVLRSVGNNIAIGTSVGVRYAPINPEGGGLDFGPAIEVGAVRDMAVESEINPDTGKLDTFVWFTWPQIHEGTESGLGRLRLTRFTEPNVPAYASDIFTEAGGTPIAVASIGGRRYFAISADGFYGATSNFVEEGELRTGRIRYGVLDTKVFNDVKWRTAPINGEIMVEAEFDDGNMTHVGDQTEEGTVGSTGHIGPVFAEWCELIFHLTRGGVIEPALFYNETGTATTPDHANFAITDLDCEWSGALENWAPGGGDRTFLWGQTNVLNNIGWSIWVDIDGKLTLIWSTDGTLGGTVTVTTTDNPAFELGSEHTIAWTLDVNNGSGGSNIACLVDGVPFYSTVGGVTSIFNSTATLTTGFGSFSPAGSGAYCRHAILRASIGGAEVANPDFTIQEVGDTSFADTVGTPKTWTVNAPAAISLIDASEDLTPRLRWWYLRAIPASEETMQILVPLRLYEKEQTPLGPIKTVKFFEELMFLMNLSNTKQVVTYQEGLVAYQVYVNNIEVNPDRWNSMDHNLEGICMVELHTVMHP